MRAGVLLSLVLAGFTGLVCIAPDARADPPAKGKGKPAGETKASKKHKPKKSAPAAPPSSAPHRTATHDAPIDLALDLHRATLANGLRVVIDVDHGAPTVAIAVVYDVGARNEERGRSGFARLFERMMFQGSRNVAKGDHEKLVASRGGELDGATNADRTRYDEVLPENELALGLWLEAERMRSLDVSQPNLDDARRGVEEELLLRASSVAYPPGRARRDELVYQGYWPYEHPTLGAAADLDAAELGRVTAFQASYYGPNNAVLSIAGDVGADEAMALARRYFEDIPRVSVPAFADRGLPDQTSPRTARVVDDHAKRSGVFYGWAIPPARSPDHAALDLCADILAGGESSRLHQSLVRDRAIADELSAGTEGRRGPDLFHLDAVVAPGAKAAEVERAIDAEIQAVAARGPSDAELAKARRRAESSALLDLASNLGRARRLGEYEISFGDARLLVADVARYATVTRDDVKRAASRYLVPDRRTIVEAVLPGSGAEEPPHRAAPPKPPPEPAGKGAKKHHKGKKAKKP